MEKKFAFFDTQNVNLSIKDQSRKLDWKKFRAYLFIWYIPENQDMYTFFQSIWYIFVFKLVLNLKNWVTKWNVDAELVLQSMIDYKKYNKTLIVPNEKKYSIFLKKTVKEKIDILTNFRGRLEYIPSC